MPYRLKAGESVAENVRRVVLEEIDSAIKELNHRNGAQRGEAIHEARKSIKKIRGVLKLMRPELGSVYGVENARLRAAGQKLSEIRDAQALIEIFTSLLDKYKNSLRPDALTSVRRGLEKSKRETEKAANVDQVMQRAIATLHGTSRRVKGWPLKSDGFQAIAPGLEQTYGRCRKAMSVVQKDPLPENYHEWRKRVKDHWYHIRLLEGLWTDVMQAHEASLKNLETWLGDDHNLVVFCGKLNAEPEKYGADNEVQLCLTLAEQHQKELRENAMSLGERVYEEKPRRFTQKMSDLWDAWQRQPGVMKEVAREQRSAPKKQPGKVASASITVAVA